jgi:hypothetical protein
MLQQTVDGDPFVEILPLRQLDSQSQISAPKGGIRVFFQFVLVRALGNVLLGAKRLCILEQERHLRAL